MRRVSGDDVTAALFTLVRPQVTKVCTIVHIPFYRPPGTTECGPHRERGTIRIGREAGYQNMPSSEISEFVLCLSSGVRPLPIEAEDRHLRLPIAAMIMITARYNAEVVFGN